MRGGGLRRPLNENFMAITPETMVARSLALRARAHSRHPFGRTAKLVAHDHHPWRRRKEKTSCAVS